MEQHFAQTQPAGHLALHNAHFCIEHFNRAEEGQRVVGTVEELNRSESLCVLFSRRCYQGTISLEAVTANTYNLVYGRGRR